MPSTLSTRNNVAKRQQWKSKLGFVLAAAGSAIGLGNIVFFSANAYRYGAGAFYLPYLLALLLCGIPVMMLEFGLGKRFQASFPIALGRVAGKWGEAIGWFAILNALIITMYYSTILAWTMGMWWSSATGTLFESTVAVPGFELQAGEMANPGASFFDLISSWKAIGLATCIWMLNYVGVLRGTQTIERVVRWMVPFIWIVMILFIVRGLTLDGGIHGAYMLFTPQFDVMASPRVWNGAFSQIFFTLSLGFGIMTAYASYLPRNTDHVTSAVVVSAMNCSFEMIAGLAIFSLLFAYAVVPEASTLGMMFFVVPQAIGSLPAGVQFLGAAFFTLLLAAGLTSSTSLLESVISSLNDKFQIPRKYLLSIVVLIGMLGSLIFGLPHVIDPELNGNGTLGLSVLDLVDHYTFSYGLMIVGFLECVIIGWMLPASRLREELNASSPIQLGRWFDVLLRWVLPGVLGFIIVWTALTDLGLLGAGAFPTLYGLNESLAWMHILPLLTPIMWLLGTAGVGIALAHRPTVLQRSTIASENA